jgi:hypothetical protein
MSLSTLIAGHTSTTPKRQTLGASEMKGCSLVSLVLGAWLHLVLADTTQTTSASVYSESSTNTTSSFEAQLTEIPTDSRATYPSEGVTSTVQSSTNATAALSSFNQTSSSSSAAIETLLHGSSTDPESASTPTTGSATCNGYAEFCDRKYSNVTYVVAHNSPFHIAHNAASNQDFDVTTQLNDGIRGSEYFGIITIGPKLIMYNRQFRAKHTTIRTRSTSATPAATS